MGSTVVSLSLDSRLLDRLEKLIEQLGYSNRSEAIRDAIRRLIMEYEFSDMRERRVLAAIVIVYEYSEGHVDRKLARIRHEYNDVVVGNLHMHIDGKYCTELLIARGEGRRVLGLIAVTKGIRGIASSRHLLLPI